MSTPAQTAANQANAQKSTGPRTEAGIAASCKNNLRHGLSGAFLIQNWERSEDFDLLLESLIEEHEPSTPTEQILVTRMAQHHWLVQRALNLQELCFKSDVPMCAPAEEKSLALYIRYQSTHERAFDKCLANLLKLRKDARKEQIGFESQQLKVSDQFRKQAAEARKVELHEARLQLLKSKLKPIEAPAKSVTPASKPVASPLMPILNDFVASKQAA